MMPELQAAREGLKNAMPHYFLWLIGAAYCATGLHNEVDSDAVLTAPASPPRAGSAENSSRYYTPPCTILLLPFLATRCSLIV